MNLYILTVHLYILHIKICRELTVYLCFLTIHIYILYISKYMVGSLYIYIFYGEHIATYTAAYTATHTATHTITYTVKHTITHTASSLHILW